MSVRYTKPGMYVAICNTADGKGHYVRVFEFPDLSKLPEDSPYAPAPEGVDASWWFLNRVDFVAWVEAVYPIDIFSPFLPKECVLSGKLVCPHQEVSGDKCTSCKVPDA
jgi:hypothetical protein